MPDSDSPFGSMMDAMAASVAAAGFAVVVAKFQSAQIKALEEEGIDRETALKLTLESSTLLVTSLVDLVKALSSNAQGIAAAAETVVKITQSQVKVGPQP